MSSRKAPGTTDLDEEEILQAVIVTDSFNKRFRPLTLDQPRCLLPLVNIPLIEYTLEFLAISGVHEIFIVCCSHSDDIKAYLKSSRWSKNSLPTVRTVVSSELISIGDALRELDAKQLLKSDFVLVTGDVVSNMNLEDAIAKHKYAILLLISFIRARKLTDKNSIMTMVLKEADPNHRTRAKGEESLFILDAKTKSCLHYDSVHLLPHGKQYSFDKHLFKDHPTLQIANNLIDCQIDICSIEVPALFTENFDYQDIRSDFVRGILESDILNKTIYAHILTDQYAARVRSTQMYDAVSRDVLSRWTFPMVPDNNIMGDTANGCYRPFIYKEKHRVKLARSAILEHHVAVGSDTAIGENSRIVDSVIGKNCKIGLNVVISGAYIWDNVEIEDDCRITRSIIASGAQILSNVTIEHGCVIGYDVILGPSVTLPAFTKLAEKSKVRDHTEIAPIGPAEIIGESGNCCIWDDNVENDEDNEEMDRKYIILGGLARDMDVLEINDDDDNIDCDSSEAEDTGISDYEGDALDPEIEIKLTLERSLTDGHTIENAALELNTLKMALNVKFRDIRQVLFPALFSRLDASNLPSSARDIFGRWSGLIKKFVHNLDDQIDCLDIMEEHCTTNQTLEVNFMIFLRVLYEADILEEEAIFQWHHQTRGSSIGVNILPFIKWLETAEEESSEDEEDA